LPPDSKPVIDIAGLRKVFINEDGQSVPVIDGLDLTVAPGEFVSVLGPTGCGKTTLLRILLGLESADAGRVRIAGSEPQAGRVPAGAVFQQNSLLPWKRVIKNVVFPMDMKGVGRREARRRAMELLRIVQLEKAARAFPYELSGGMQQRASIARALAHEAGIMLMDEPFGALDDRTRRVLQRALLQIWRDRSLTIVFVTHNIEEALLMGDRVIVMGRGVILEDERIELPRPRDPLSEDFAEMFLRLRTTFAAAVAGDEEPDPGEKRPDPARPKPYSG
jgi:ABC-type nitrate/sulfonate/bicarbonate transport system ATPase subunit